MLLFQLPVRELMLGVSLSLLASALTHSAQAEGHNSQERPFALMVGDAAPAVKAGKWITGKPVEQLQKGNVYVIDFWATWCPPCLEEIPKLTQLQEKYGSQGVQIIGITKPDPQNTYEIVSQLIEKQAVKVGYAIAMDSERATFDAWMKAAGQNFIPTAFIVDAQGRIAEILQPDEEDLEAPLAKIVRGQWDLEARIKSYRAEMTIVAKGNQLQDRLGQLRKKKNWPAAVKVCDELLALDAAQFVPAASDKFQILLLEMKDFDLAYAFGRQAVDSIANNDARTLNRIAYPIVDPKNNVVEKDLKLARKAAERANELNNGKGPYVLQTLARIAFLEGDVDKAIETQKKAAGLAQPEEREDFERIAADYQRAVKP